MRSEDNVFLDKKLFGNFLIGYIYICIIFFVFIETSAKLDWLSSYTFGEARNIDNK